MSSPVQLPLVARPHRNQQLFSDHYLDDTLPRLPAWKALAVAGEAVRPAIQALLAGYTPSANERQTEDGLIQPVLTALGHTVEVQPRLQVPGGSQQPDYVFYRDPAARQAQRGHLLTDAVAQQGAFAVGEAKYWDRPLDQTLKRAGGDPFTNRNPTNQIAFYVQHSGLEWGILTNGRLWRLYHRSSAHKLDRYYEVDLPAVLEDPARFVYFYAFFRRAAFDPGPLSLAALLQASTEYAQGVGNRLKTQVYEALRHLAQGFLDYPANGLEAADPATRKAIYDHALILLYRLLFILYAEARDLLPVQSSELYREEYSLLAIKQAVAADLGRGQRRLPTTARLWQALKDLFGIIERGSPPLRVATFDGGLFDPERHPFLERYTVGDAHLQAALDRLARVDGRVVDYRDLTVRHLGAIYEGLLEFHLEALPAPDPASWTVDLRTDKGERHATGSYYTPDYIVKYIVEATLEPLLRAAVASAGDERAQAAAVLRLNVLDPAMGSGHFLVEATEYIARFLVELALPPGDAGGEADLAAWKRRVVQSCIYGVDLNPLAVELAKLSLWLATVARDRPLSFLDHHLRAGNALVGARLADIPAGAPAPPAPRRPRKRAEAAGAAGQLSWLDDAAFVQSMSTAVDSMWLIESNPGQTVADVKEQARIYATLHADLIRRYGRAADLVTAVRLGLPVDPALWRPLVDQALGRTLAGPPQFAAWLAAAEERATARRFFHWELEYPEVFFDPHGQPRGAGAGFDAVIGNPPYVRQEELAPLKPYLQATYPAVYHGTADLFVYFFGQGLHLLREGGRLAYIASNSWLRANYATPLRAFLRNSSTVETVIDLGDNRVFADAPDVYPAIHVVRREPPPGAYAAQAAVFTRGEGLAAFATQVAAKLFPVTIHDQLDSGWHLGGDAERRVLAKLLAGGRPLGDVVEGRMYYGVKTGLNEAFIIDQATRDRLVGDDPACQAVLKPIVRGEDLRPWYQENEGRWLIALPNGWTAATFGAGLTEPAGWAQFAARHPALAAHLLPFADAARKRQDKGQYWWELRPCDYYDAFERPKILWPDITKIPRFSWDESGLYLGNTGYILVTPERWLLGYLASRCAWFLISHSAISLGERAGLNRYRLIDQYMRPLPVPTPADAERAVLGDLALAITEQARARYALHVQTRRRILADLGVPRTGLNQKLTAWWDLDWPAFRAEIEKVFRHDIPLKARDEWAAWLAEQQAAHAAHTAAIIRLETDLNARVSALFGLTPAEITLIAQATKYRYGEP